MVKKTSTIIDKRFIRYGKKLNNLFKTQFLNTIHIEDCFKKSFFKYFETIATMPA